MTGTLCSQLGFVSGRMSCLGVLRQRVTGSLVLAASVSKGLVFTCEKMRELSGLGSDWSMCFCVHMGVSE